MGIGETMGDRHSQNKTMGTTGAGHWFAIFVSADGCAGAFTFQFKSRNGRLHTAFLSSVGTTRNQTFDSIFDFDNLTMSLLLLVLTLSFLVVASIAHPTHSRPSLLDYHHQQQNDTTACDRFQGDLPDECDCAVHPHHRLVIDCLHHFNTTSMFLANDTVGLRMDLDICNPQGSQLDLAVVEQRHNLTYVVAGITAGEERNFPIPGWSFIVPGLGHVGMDVAVYIAGNPDQLTLQVGLNACAVVVGPQGQTHTVCADRIPGLSNVLPWYVLSGSYSFGDWCEQVQEGEYSEHGMEENEDDAVEATFIRQERVRLVA